MKRVSVKLPEGRVNELDQIADDDGVSRSEVIRNHLDDALNTSDDEAYEDRIQELETEVERLKNEKRLILEDREEKQELVEFAQRERSLREEEAEERRKQRQAGVMTRMKWWLTGVPEQES